MKALPSVVLLCGLVATSTASLSAWAEDGATTGTVQTRIGPIELDKGLPANAKAADKIFAELDFQRACQLYIWGVPIVGFEEWQKAHREVFGGSDTDLVVYQNYKDKLGILTANATTPYIIGFPDLARTGPLVIDYPAGPTAGGVIDFWQRPVVDMGQSGPDKGKGAKYLIVGPGQTVPADIKGYIVLKSPTLNIFAGFRALEPDPVKARALVKKVHMYPYAQRNNPPPTRMILAEGKPYSQVPPRGMKYWESLNDAIQKEPVETRDRFFMSMLKPLGIEKGQPFKPTEAQIKLLTDGAMVGELMAMDMSFNKRFDNAYYRPDSKWAYVIMFDPTQETKNYSQLDERNDYFYEAVTSTKGMVSKTPGVGQAYLGAYKDKNDQWFDGGKLYKLHVPADVPAKQFWSLTVYDTYDRVLIDNKEGVADKSSIMDLVRNADGTTDLYIGPKAPAGFEKNWIPSVPGKAWFAYFRLYGPEKPYFDRSWKLPDIAAAQ
jgi:hypothetical protein